ncbi:peptidoglycan bridge formation glycyltransferase FemA/FemB family protein [Candidatus Peribacteria bacterium]|nr:MAG: peptidoglycan bridge formation glycyltransferase FemA/FemB family protein [Candidatus Peribacteria bacterium]
MITQIADNRQEWDDFLKSQRFSPFLQSWTMGEVYRDIGQEPVRLEVRDDGKIVGICQAILVPARRGRHLMVQYGPVVGYGLSVMGHGVFEMLVDGLKEEARKHRCSFVRMSPFASDTHQEQLKGISSPLHLLAEHIWYLPLTTDDQWPPVTHHSLPITKRSEEEILMAMRKTTRNLIRRAEKDGVTVELSTDPVRDVEEFIKLHDETRKRHHFTPYTNSFFRAQVKRFAEAGNVLVYIAKHEGQILATSIHMQFGGETSYHHGASVMTKVPASYLLQWRAIQDAIKRGDSVYNFWGIAPMSEKKSEDGQESKAEILNPKHPFAGVTLFKTGFGGKLLNLEHCFDLPLSSKYYLTRTFEYIRKWKRGF